MAILSSREGKFYDIPDADLKKHEVPAGKVKEILSELDGGSLRAFISLGTPTKAQ